VKTYLRLAVLLLSGVVFCGTALRAQAPANAGKIYTRKTSFKLPVKIDDKDRATLDKIQLYVKNGPNAMWALKATAPATQSDFAYHVEHDGEYWFSVVTVDKNGRATPADVAHEPPGLMVVVDTHSPEFDVRPITLSDGSSAVKCTMKDANPDLTSLRVECKGEAGQWELLQPMADNPGMYRMPDGAARSTIRVSGSDMARNNTTREINPWMTHPAAAQPLETVSGPTLLETQSDKAPAPMPSAPLDHSMVMPAAASSGSIADSSPTISSETAPASITTGRSMQLINSIHASLDYQIDEVGPSGIGRVEVWITKDEGQTWMKLCEDPDRRSPADIDLPGDGLYGVSLVVSNGNGVSAAPPGKGDRPNWWIEVDTTKPQAKLLSVKATVEDPSSFEIMWEASDKNLKQEPIDLYYCTQRGGLWVPIARGLPNTGHYRWSVPRNAGSEFYIRMEASDRAGNIARCDAPQPVYLDLARPKARVVGVNAMANHPYGN